MDRESREADRKRYVGITHCERCGTPVLDQRAPDNGRTVAICETCGLSLVREGIGKPWEPGPSVPSPPWPK
jgi:hypothetical protein